MSYMYKQGLSYNHYNVTFIHLMTSLWCNPHKTSLWCFL